MRIVSLLPSATEIICELGLREQLVGVTHECDWPSSVQQLPRVTRTLVPTNATSSEIDALVRERMSGHQALYTLDMDVLRSLEPDLIVTQALCDVCAVAEDEVAAAACELPGAPRVLNLEPESLDEVLGCMETVARAAGVPEIGAQARGRLERRIAAVVSRNKRVAKPISTVLIEWLEPLFGCGHWSPGIIELAGGRELIGNALEKSRTFEWEELRVLNPQAIIVACCGLTVERTMEEIELLTERPGWNQVEAVMRDRVFVMDGAAYFSRPGPRLVDALELVAASLHPELHPEPLAESNGSSPDSSLRIMSLPSRAR